MTVKPILAMAALVSLVIGGAGIAAKSSDGGKCPGDCAVECSGDCGTDCPGDCCIDCPRECSAEHRNACDEACGRGELRAKPAGKAEAKGNAARASAIQALLVSHQGKGRKPDHGCGFKCGHGEGHHDGHSQRHEGCGDKSGHGTGKEDAKADGTDARPASFTTFTSLGTEVDGEAEGEGTCPGRGIDCPADRPADCPADRCADCPGDCCLDCPREDCAERCNACDEGCGRGENKPNGAKETEGATSAAVAAASSTQ